MKQVRFFLWSFLLSVILSPALHAATYEIDPAQSEVKFKIRSWFFHVGGRFKDFKGSVQYDPKDSSSWSTEAVIQTSSIDTKIGSRDKHLRSPDFFDAARFPAITFKSTGVSNVTASSAKLNGELTLHGVTKPVVLDLKIKDGGDAKDQTHAHFTATGTLDRKDFGMTWNKAAEGGGMIIGHDVKVTIEIEAVRKS